MRFKASNAWLDCCDILASFQSFSLNGWVCSSTSTVSCAFHPRPRPRAATQLSNCFRWCICFEGSLQFDYGQAGVWNAHCLVSTWLITESSMCWCRTDEFEVKSTLNHKFTNTVRGDNDLISKTVRPPQELQRPPRSNGQSSIIPTTEKGKRLIYFISLIHDLPQKLVRCTSSRVWTHCRLQSISISSSWVMMVEVSLLVANL